ncbi:hypothetical protein AOLI_G00076660 [Acnodon oligacanthus]
MRLQPKNFSGAQRELNRWAKMYTVLLFIYLGGTTLPFVKCFSDGNFDDDQDVCQSMAVSHNDLASQDPASNPFTVDPDYVDVTVLGTVVTVSLTANSAGRVFRGFLLEARETNDGPPVGVFSLSDSSISRLQSCNGIVGRAVTQINNQNKTAVTVSWTTPNTGRYYFRATFLSDPTTITEVISLVPTSTTDPTKSSASTQLSDPTTTTQVTSLVPTSTNVPTASTGTTSAKSDLSVCKPGSDWFLILLLASYLSLVEGFPFLMKHRKRRNVVVMQVSSVLSLLFSLVAFIISLILTELVAAKVLTGLAVFLSLCQVIVIFSFCGPSHELCRYTTITLKPLIKLCLLVGPEVFAEVCFHSDIRRQLCWAFGLVTFANICLTTAAIFVGLVKCKICLWLLIVMAAYLASDLLFYMLCLIFTFKKPGRISQRISFRSLCLVILTLVNIAFTVALIIGIFLCNYGTVTTKQSSGNM